VCVCVCVCVCVRVCMCSYVTFEPRRPFKFVKYDVTHVGYVFDEVRGGMGVDKF